MAEKTAVEKASVEKKVIPEAEELPKAIVRRVVKDKLSQLSKDGADISVFKEALMAFSESARIFIHYLSAMANDICKESKRQTINAEDVFKALEEMEFPEFVGPLKASLEGSCLPSRGPTTPPLPPSCISAPQPSPISLTGLVLVTDDKVLNSKDEKVLNTNRTLAVLAKFRQKNAGKRSASKAKEANKKKKIKESPVENGVEEDMQDEGKTNTNEDENENDVTDDN